MWRADRRARGSTGVRCGMPGYTISQRIRKRIEESFGWGKWVGTIRQVKVRGRDKVNDALHWIGWNLVRLRTLAETG